MFGLTRGTTRLSVLSAGVAIAILAGPPAPSASDVSCQVDGVGVFVESAADAGFICEAAGAALAVLSSIGIEQTRPVVIEVADELPHAGPRTVGCYDWREDRVYLRGPDALADRATGGSFFGVGPDERVYASFVAHETAHAVSSGAFTICDPSIAAQEYIAGVVQISVMAPELRQQVLDRYAGDGFDAPVQIHLLIYQIDPARFAVEAYRHFMTAGNGPDFIADLLSGDIRLQDELPY